MLRHPQDQPASIGVAEKWCKGPDADIPLKCENRNLLLLLLRRNVLLRGEV